MGAVVGGGQEGEEDEELRQTKEQAAARRRWETLVRFIHSPLLGIPCLLILFASFPCNNWGWQWCKFLLKYLGSKMRCWILWVLPALLSCKCNMCLNSAPWNYVIFGDMSILKFWAADYLYDCGMLCLKIREQKIKTLTPREAGYTFKLTDKALLDVRPSNERQKVVFLPIILKYIKLLFLGHIVFCSSFLMPKLVCCRPGWKALPGFLYLTWTHRLIWADLARKLATS